MYGVFFFFIKALIKKKTQTTKTLPARTGKCSQEMLETEEEQRGTCLPDIKKLFNFQ